jgi:hypothetical protein
MAVTDAVRKYGSAQWPAAAIPEQFTDWRRAIRAAARATGLRISVRRVQEMVFIQHLDHVVTDDEMQAFSKIIASQI